jgi:hypothetical protein
MKTKALIVLLFFIYSMNNNSAGQNDYNLFSHVSVDQNKALLTPGNSKYILDSIYHWRCYYKTNSNWYLTSKEIAFNYDNNLNLISKLHQGNSNNSWHDSITYTCSYNLNNKITKQLALSLVFLNSDTFIYDSSQLLICQQTENTWFKPYAKNKQKIIYSYNKKKQLTTQLFQTIEDSSCFTTGLDTFIYDLNKNLISKMSQRNGNCYFKEFYDYDLYNNLITTLFYEWNNNDWKYIGISNYVYDANNLIKSYTHSVIDNGDSHTYYYHIVTGIKDPVFTNNGITIFPNPNSGNFTIKSNVKLNSVEIYNLTGELIYTNFNLKSLSSVDINLSNLQKGIYFARIQQAKQVMTEKIIIQ